MGKLWIVNSVIFLPSAPAAPKDVLEALEQRRGKYVEASAQAKAGGDDRKARMHDRIAKVRGDALLLGVMLQYEENPSLRLVVDGSRISSVV